MLFYFFQLLFLPTGFSQLVFLLLHFPSFCFSILVFSLVILASIFFFAYLHSSARFWGLELLLHLPQFRHENFVLFSDSSFSSALISSNIFKTTSISSSSAPSFGLSFIISTSCSFCSLLSIFAFL